MTDLDTVLGLIPYFHPLRPDERASVVERWSVRDLPVGASIPLGDIVLTVVLSGQITLGREGSTAMDLHPGDWTDDLRAIVHRGASGAITARTQATVGLLDATALQGLFTVLPILALPFVTELGREVRGRNDLLREVYLARAAGLPPEALRRVVNFRRRRLQRDTRVALRRAWALLVRAVITEPSRRLAFWVFVGATSALVSARTVVGIILHRHLQGSLFALISSRTGHPIHVHHFNYGLTLVSITGLLSMIPRARQSLRGLALVFGFGVGLIVDEFALLWNLDPDYYQPSSRLVAALLVFVLFQLVYARGLWAAIFRRLLAWVRA